jgi:hypothetical protein
MKTRVRTDYLSFLAFLEAGQIKVSRVLIWGRRHDAKQIQTVPVYPGLPALRGIGVLGYWGIGVLEYWGIGVLGLGCRGCGVVGLLGCWGSAFGCLIADFAAGSATTSSHLNGCWAGAILRQPDDSVLAAPPARRVVVMGRFPALKRRAWSLAISAFNAVAVPVCPRGTTRK